MDIQHRQPPGKTVDPFVFNDLAAKLAAGMAIVTCWGEEDDPLGLATRSLTTLSIDPPRLLVCAPLLSSAHDSLVRSKRCGVALLSADDIAEAQVFADPRRRPERFLSGRWRLRPPDPPSLTGGVFSATCAVTSVVAAEDHSILILAVVEASAGGGDPLVAFNHELLRLSTDERKVAQFEA